MRIVRAHKMTQGTAKQWIESQLPGLLREFGSSVRDLTHSWQGYVMEFSFSVDLGGRFRGTLQVTETDFALDVPFGLLQRPFQGMARARMEQWLNENLPDP